MSQRNLRIAFGATCLGIVVLGPPAHAQLFTRNTTTVPVNAGSTCENVDFADIDNDGDWDAAFACGGDDAQLQNPIWINQGFAQAGTVGSYLDATAARAPAILDQSRDIEFVDFDADGDVDIYVNNGGPSNVLINDVISDFPPFVQFYIAWEPAENLLLRNDGTGHFTDVTRGSGAEGPGIGSGVGAADLNDDGFPDLFVTNRTYYAAGKRVSPAPGQNRLFVNRGNRNHWIKVRLVGARGNRNAYGAMIKVTSGDLVQYHETQSAHGYNSTSDPVITFGLGARTQVESIEVRWPDGTTQSLSAPPVGTIAELVEAAR
jgi:hypothetical protein